MVEKFYRPTSSTNSMRSPQEHVASAQQMAIMIGVDAPVWLSHDNIGDQAFRPAAIKYNTFNSCHRYLLS
jgi:hypothetical protein